MISTAVRRATAAEVPGLAATLAHAFLDDPVAAWACRPEKLRTATLEGFYAVRLRQLLVHKEVWTTEDLACAALWAPPERWKTSSGQDAALARLLLRPRLVARMPLVVAGLLGIERRHPAAPPHWYLAVLGTHPAAQGQGLASAVLAPVLEECDAHSLGAYLESSKERNIDFYSRHGFRVTSELRLPRGPSIWPMWREPAPRR